MLCEQVKGSYTGIAVLEAGEMAPPFRALLFFQRPGISFGTHFGSWQLRLWLTKCAHHPVLAPLGSQ